LSVFVNIGLLFAFKYFNFVSTSVAEFLSVFSINFSAPVLNVLLPVGISFYTFQTLSYTLDVYKKKREPERHLGIFAVYVSFFPQLVAGPIERSKNLLPQFFEKHKISYEGIKQGLVLVIWGFFKKIVIADRLAAVVNVVYGNPSEYSGIPLIIATIFFAFQIYCDFSGYSDIAIGTARIMGFGLMNNFKRPYFSKSISEFWNRWHISLSTWFRDYIYIPLLGKKISFKRLYFALMFVFLISGLWHGAYWTFIIWGGLHGFYLVFSLMTEKVRKKISKKVGLLRFPKLQSVLKILIVFFLVNIGWIFFRANTLADAWYVLTHIFSITLNFDTTVLGIDRYDFFIGIIAIILMEMVHVIQEKSTRLQLFFEKRRWLKWSVYTACVVAILAFGVYDTIEFIYFQF